MANSKSQKRKKEQERRIKRFLIGVLCAILALTAGIIILVNALSRGYELEDENHPVATITLSNGKKVIVELFSDKAPMTVANFIELANAGFYDGLEISLEGDKLQTGDKIGDGSGGAGYRIVGEFSLNGRDNDLSHARGTLSMAHLTGYDTASSQFFVCLSDMPYLDGGYAAFGRVVKGMEYLDALKGANSDPSAKITASRRIRQIRVEAKEFSYEFDKFALINY